MDMKRSLIISFFLAMSLLVSGQQLSGIKNIPGDYATIQLAIADLNLKGVGTGGVIFNVAAGHTESFSSPTAGTITATGTASDTIVFRKSGTGANPLITAGVGTSATTDGIIKFAGSDYITFDGINLQERSTNITSTTRMEWGFALVKKQNIAPFNGCQFIVIKNCKVTLTENNASKGIYTANHIATAKIDLAITATSDAHNNCKFFNDTVVNCMEPVTLNGFNASAPYGLYDQNNEVGVGGGNVILTIGGATGIYAIYQNNLKIANNTITEPGTAITELSGIYTSTANAAKISIYGNTVSITNIAAASTTVNGIKCYSGSSVAGSVVRIFNNLIQNCGFTGFAVMTFNGINIGTAPDSVYIYNNSIINNIIPGTGDLYGINITPEYGPANLSIFSNTISGNKKTGASGIIYCVRTTTSNIEFYSNNIYNNTFPASSGTALAQILGYHNGSQPAVENIYMNNIYNLTLSGTNTNSSTGIYGISAFSNGDRNIYSNNIHGFSSHKGVVTGILSPHGGTVSIFRNNIYDLYSGSGESNQTSVLGIWSNGTTNAYIYNNFISDLKTTSASFSNAISGIYQGYSTSMGQQLYLFDNTIYLNASSSGTTFGTSAFYCGNTDGTYYFVMVMNNNIFVNVSVPNGSGLTVVHRRYGPYLAGYSNLSNNNDFYAGTPGPYHLLMYNGTQGFETMADYQNWASPRESKSFSENPPFLDITNRPYDLHLNPVDASLFESGGIVISTPISIIDDFDNDPRYPNSGYPDLPAHPAIAPDVGADEFAGFRLDLVPPVIEFTPLDNTASLIERTLTATITDDYSGVPVSGDGLPQLYWRIRHGVTGPWHNTQGVSIGNDQYDFTFGAGGAVHDTVDYYIVAQDLAPMPNVSTSAGYSGAFTYNPPACVDVPYSFNEYSIMGYLCGTYNVGVGQYFETITQALEALDNNIGTCPITLLLTDEEYLLDYTPLTINSYPWSDATKTLTIKPAPGVTPHIASNSSDAIFNIMGSSYVTIDGSNTVGGNDRSITLENLCGCAYAVVNLSQGVKHFTVKNCIINGGSRESTNFDFYASGGGYIDITVQNNEFLNASTGFYMWGNSENSSNTGLITQNDFGSQTDAFSLGLSGIQIYNADGFTISENTIQNIKSTDDVYGIYIGTDVMNTFITRNMITGIKYTGGSDYAARGIAIQTLMGISNIVVANNVISDICSNSLMEDLSWCANSGIGLDNTGGVDLYYNSVSLTGKVQESSAGSMSAAIFLSSVNNIRMKNNIFGNSIVDTTNEAVAYSIYYDGPNTAFTEIDNNDYFASGPQGILGYLGGDAVTLSDWQSATGQDDFSLDADPLFISVTDLHPSTGSPVLGAGVPITGITEDYSGNVRSGTNPSIGAFEYGENTTFKTLTMTVLLEGLYAGNGTMNQAYDDMGPHFGTGIADQVTVELHNPSSYPSIEYSKNEVNLSTSGTLTITTVPSWISSDYYITILHRNSIETVSALPVSFAGATINYDFSTSSSQAYFDNLKDTGDGFFVIWGGDVNQDGIVDGGDMNPVDNASTAITFGYVPEDVNGDGIVDGGDMNIVDNNSTAIIMALIP
jgi:trimeric autotransporter adhesin